MIFNPQNSLEPGTISCIVRNAKCPVLVVFGRATGGKNRLTKLFLFLSFFSNSSISFKFVRHKHTS